MVRFRRAAFIFSTYDLGKVDFKLKYQKVLSLYGPIGMLAGLVVRVYFFKLRFSGVLGILAKSGNLGKVGKKLIVVGFCFEK